MKLLHLLGAASLALVAGCVSERTSVNDHWSTYSIGPRVGRAFLGYDRNQDGESYLDFQCQILKFLAMKLIKLF